MTNCTRCGEPKDAQPTVTFQEEAVTPKMIEAGVGAYAKPNAYAAESVKAIYLAMTNARDGTE